MMKEVKTLVGFVLLLSTLIIFVGCSTDEADSIKANTVILKMDYDLFVQKVKDHQVDSVVIYPKDETIIAVMLPDKQQYIIDYSKLREQGPIGHSISDMLLENDVPFKAGYSETGIQTDIEY